jgi:probable addiction module antidote protein
VPKRSKNWDKVLQKQLKKPKFAHAYIKAALKDGIPLQTILGQVIRAMGVVEYAAKVGMAAPNLHRILRSNANPTLDTLQVLLAPLGLRISVIENSCRKAA